jgi:hypothetical protein
MRSAFQFADHWVTHTRSCSNKALLLFLLLNRVSTDSLYINVIEFSNINNLFELIKYWFALRLSDLVSVGLILLFFVGGAYISHCACISPLMIRRQSFESWRERNPSIAAVYEKMRTRGMRILKAAILSANFYAPPIRTSGRAVWIWINLDGYSSHLRNGSRILIFWIKFNQFAKIMTMLFPQPK